jgi:hypothetical protein
MEEGSKSFSLASEAEGQWIEITANIFQIIYKQLLYYRKVLGDIDCKHYFPQNSQQIAGENQSKNCGINIHIFS